jgi:MFS transporter, DHA2 family, multidrug resistance protein
LGARVTVTLGLGISAIGSVLLAIGVDRGLVFSFAASAVVGIGLSLLIAPASTVVMNALPRPRRATGRRSTW